MTTPGLTRATFTSKNGKTLGEKFPVHFNPSSLDYAITNTLEGGNGQRSAQYVSKSTGKLSMELVFDTTDSGEDVRVHTEKVARLMVPVRGGGNSKSSRPPPPTALFDWGAYHFEGIVESYREKIDFFSATGVPLRATVNLTLTQQEIIFKESEKTAGPKRGTDPVSTVQAPIGAKDNVGSVAQAAGDPTAARDIAASNGFESIRSPDAAIVLLGPSVELGPPVTFAAGGAGFGASASFGAAAGLDVDFSAGASFGASASFGAGASFDASFGIGANGSVSASASISADLRLAGSSNASGMAGSFLQTSADLGTGKMPAGLFGAGKATPKGNAPGASTGAARRTDPRPSVTTPTPFQPGGVQTFKGADVSILGSFRAGGSWESGVVSAGVPAAEGPLLALTQNKGFRSHTGLDPESLVRSVNVSGYGTGASVGFLIGGQATMLGASSVAADVGRDVRLSERIRFDRGTGGDDR